MSTRPSFCNGGLIPAEIAHDASHLTPLLRIIVPRSFDCGAKMAIQNCPGPLCFVLPVAAAREMPSGNPGKFAMRMSVVPACGWCKCEGRAAARQIDAGVIGYIQPDWDGYTSDDCTTLCTTMKHFHNFCSSSHRQKLVAQTCQTANARSFHCFWCPFHFHFDVQARTFTYQNGFSVPPLQSTR